VGRLFNGHRFLGIFGDHPHRLDLPKPPERNIPDGFGGLVGKGYNILIAANAGIPHYFIVKGRRLERPFSAKTSLLKFSKILL